MWTLQEGFADFIRRRMEELKFSTYDVARESGGAITHQTVWSVLNAGSKDIKLSTLVALAIGVHVPEEELFRVLIGRPEPPTKAPEVRAGRLDEEEAFAERIADRIVAKVLEKIEAEGKGGNHHAAA